MSVLNDSSIMDLTPLVLIDVWHEILRCLCVWLVFVSRCRRSRLARRWCRGPGLLQLEASPMERQCPTVTSCSSLIKAVTANTESCTGIWHVVSCVRVTEEYGLHLNSVWTSQWISVKVWFGGGAPWLLPSRWVYLMTFINWTQSLCTMSHLTWKWLQTEDMTSSVKLAI